MSAASDGLFSATFAVASSATEVLETALFDNGAVSITLTDEGDERLLEPDPGEHPLWSNVILNAFFADESQMEIACDAVAAIAVPEKTVQIDDQQWPDEQHFPTLRFANRLEILAADAEPSGNADAGITRIRIRPGLAFGTGLHQTTALCLDYLAENPPDQARCTDFGCGSGILAIAALAFGASSVLAIDHDEQALESTRNNSALNHVAGELHISAPHPLPDSSCELLMANILLRPLCDLAAQFAMHVVPGGGVVLSGILTEQLPELRAAFDPYFQNFIERRQDEWALLAGTRRSTTMG